MFIQRSMMQVEDLEVLQSAVKLHELYENLLVNLDGPSIAALQEFQLRPDKAVIFRIFR